ncbi:MAG: Uma2 family endonuclease [Caldilineaceae bacterium]|nr:Uma2 family endonuclease [Caldilineaceae bacterium]
MSIISKPTAIRPTADPHAPNWELGWRYETVTHPDGTTEEVRVALTLDEALHPEEGYVMPVRSSHARITNDLVDMLRAYFAQEPGIAIFDDLVFVWDHSEVRNYAPDVAVVPNVRDPVADRGRFVVAEEGTGPRLIIEVVSPATRTGDRVDKVRDYPLVGVQEYVYIDQWQRKGQTVWEVVGYRLVGDHYLPLVPDEDGALYLETVNLRIGMEEGQVWLEDANTGQDLMTSLEAHRALQGEIAARQAAEAHAAALEAELAELRRQLGQSNA